MRESQIYQYVNDGLPGGLAFFFACRAMMGDDKIDAWSRRVPEIQVRMKVWTLRADQTRIEHPLTFQIIIGFGRS